MCAPAPRNDKKNKHRCPLQRCWGHTRWSISRRFFRCFRHTSRSTAFDGHAKPLDWKSTGPSLSGEALAACRGKRREWNQTIQVRWLMHRLMHGLDTYSVRCDRLRGCWLTGVSARDLLDWWPIAAPAAMQSPLRALGVGSAAPGVPPRRQLLLAAGFLSPTW